MTTLDFALRALDAIVQVTMGFVIGRVVLELLIGPRENFFLDMLRKPTDPIFGLVRRAAPRANYLVVAALAMLVLFTVRIAIRQLHSLVIVS
jgi:uncharacterized protein YggT (Ycf19 family)